jgi:hypothetical protein
VRSRAADERDAVAHGEQHGDDALVTREPIARVLSPASGSFTTRPPCSMLSKTIRPRSASFGSTAS